jgi:hypothetical protein
VLAYFWAGCGCAAADQGVADAPVERKEQGFRRSFRASPPANLGLAALIAAAGDKYQVTDVANILGSLANERWWRPSWWKGKAADARGSLRSFGEVLAGRGYAFHTLRHYKAV